MKKTGGIKMVYKVIVDFYNIKTDALSTEIYQKDEKPTKEWVRTLKTDELRVDGVYTEEI